MKLAKEVRNADSIAETPWSKLFHEARTTSRKTYTSVSVPVSVTSDGVKVGDVVKTRQGEHFHMRDTSWDGVISLPVKPFMDTQTARQELSRRLKEFERHNSE